MKIPLFFLAALVAFFALPFDFTTMISALFAAGLAAIVVSDYRRAHRAAVAGRGSRVAAQSPERLQLAA